MRMIVHREEWPLARPFRIARSTMHVARPLVVELQDGTAIGRGECEAHETDLDVIEASARQLESLRPAFERGELSREMLQSALPACPIRNALDCALWDLEARRSGVPVWRLAGLEAPRPLTTVYTISVDEPQVMATQAAAARHLPILKVKLEGAGDPQRMRAVRAAAPACRLIVDANESWSFEQLAKFAPLLAELGVELIEQPLPRGHDEALSRYRSPVPLCADESCLDTATLADVVGRYHFVNIKLDKAGGLTEALRLVGAARDLGLGIMVGCMVGTSLAMAPALLLAQHAAFVDIDGPLLLARDREPALFYHVGMVSPPPPGLWG